MKNDPIHILILGNDQGLLETRQWVLQSRGYRVHTTDSLAGVAALPETKPIRVCLLCHSLMPAERKAAIELIQGRWPQARVLALAPVQGRAPTGILGQLLHTMDGPAQLVAQVSEAVRQSEQPMHARAS